jgi:hypothetical protein
MKTKMLLSLFAVPIAGCAPVDLEFGDAHRWNIEQQVVNPEPVYALSDIEGGDGERGVAAVERLQTDRVKQPVGTSTTIRTGGQGGAGAGVSGSTPQ